MASKRRGRTPLPDNLKRVSFAVRLPRELIDEFRSVCGREPAGEITRVVEACVRRYVAKKRKEHGDG